MKVNRMKDRLISESRFVEDLYGCLDGFDFDLEDVLNVLKGVESVDAVPVVHGFLKNVPYKNFDPPDAPYGNEVDEETGWTFEWDTKTVCSVCGYEPYSFKPKYCENCGAHMDENEGEQDEIEKNRRT